MSSETAIAQDRKPLKRALVFLGLYALLEGLAQLLNVTGVLEGPTRWTAAATAALANATGVPATLSGIDVHLTNHVLVINGECVGVFLIAAYIALVVSSPAASRAKVLGVALGVPAILLANMARLLLVAQTSERAPDAFAFLHDYVFQVVLVLVVLATWAVWLMRARGHAS